MRVAIALVLSDALLFALSHTDCSASADVIEAQVCERFGYDGGVHRHPCSCHDFIRCVNDVAVRQTCAPLYYDRSSESCVIDAPSDCDFCGAEGESRRGADASSVPRCAVV